MATKTIKRKHVSMKKKAGWRKNFQLAEELEDFTEEKLQNERIGKGTFKGIIEDKKPLTVRQFPSRTLKKLKAQEPPRCFLSLENTSKVTDPISKRNIRKVQQSEVATSIPPVKLVKKKKQKEFGQDIWNEAENTDASKDNENQEWFGIALKRHHLKKTSFVAPKLLLEKRNKIKTIEEPVVGSSYNPSEKEFSTLVDKAIKRETAIIKKEERYANSLKQVYKGVSRNSLKRMRKEEMTQGLPHTIDKNEKDEEYEGSASIPVVNKKKDLKKRRNQHEEKMKIVRAKKTKLELQKLKDLKKLNEFEKDIKVVEETVEQKKARRELKKQEAKFQPGRLARKKFEGDELPLQGTTAPVGTLRKVVNSENLLVDRFKSLQKRNILPLTIKRKPRKGRVTTIKKNQHKGEL